MDAGEIDARVQQAVASSQRDLMNHLDGLISDKFKTFETRISDNQRELSDSQLSKIQQNILSNENYQFKKKSCEDQFKFNAKVLGKFRDADAHASSEAHHLDLTQDIAEGINLINNRQKLIRMADSSELGWRVVEQYVSNPLASDEEDEKRINRAEARATKIAKQDKQKRIEKGQRARRYMPYPRAKFPTTTATTSAPIQTIPPTSRRPGLCFECGLPNHWKFECPNRKSGAKDKISTCYFICSPRSESKAIKNSTCDMYVNKQVNVIQCSGQSNVKSIFTGESTCSTQATPVNDTIELTQISTESCRSEENVNTESPVGRLKACKNQWIKAGANRYVLSVLEDGYRIPFTKLPESVCLKNNKTARENPSFVSAEIQRLTEKGCIVKVKERPWVVNPLTVAYNKKCKPRLVLDCRHINPFLCTFKFKYEDASVVRQLFEIGDFVFTFDLKAAYHHIEVFSLHRTYLGFSWTSDGKTEYFTFRSLPFGLSTSGFIFTKVMRVIVSFWRSRGHRVVMFLDDGIGGDRSLEKARKVSIFLKESLLSFGFLIAEDKCCWEPAQVSIWLGYLWNFVTGMLYVTEERIARLEMALDSLMFQLNKDNVHLVPVRFLASVVGQIISLQNSVGKQVRLKTRSLYQCILARASWNALVHVDAEAVSEIRFWRKNVRPLNDKGMSFIPNNECEIDAFSDASADGYGGYVSLCAGTLSEGTEVLGAWDPSERLTSSTYRETEAVRRVLNSNIDVLQGKKVKWFSDNKNVKSVLKSGSRKSDLQEIAVSVHQTCEERDITLIPEWIPRSQNQVADSLSRGLDSDDWQIQTWVFISLDKVWGPHTIDRFASHMNTHCVRFNSRWWCPGTEGVNAFDQNWSGECNWLVPAPRDVLMSLKKLENEKSKGTLVVPLWKSAPFWPMLQPTENDFAEFVKDYKILPQYNVTKSGCGNNGIFGENPLSFKMLALKVIF